jgi:predicted lipoprotein with Yx(FWY)xxD motif
MTGPTPAAATEQPALNAVRAFDLGQIVVDGQGFTVYRYDKDSTNPPKSVCAGPCEQSWKPIPAAAAQTLNGIAGNLVGSLTRSDGTDQATLAGSPLYRYAKDEMPGETAGQGIGGVWFPITPEGGKVLVVASPGQSDAFGL